MKNLVDSLEQAYRSLKKFRKYYKSDFIGAQNALIKLNHADIAHLLSEQKAPSFWQNFGGLGKPKKPLVADSLSGLAMVVTVEGFCHSAGGGAGGYYLETSSGESKTPREYAECMGWDIVDVTMMMDVGKLRRFIALDRVGQARMEWKENE